jgi:4-hydroxy-2-oxoheptanedioate aldolase
MNGFEFKAGLQAGKRLYGTMFVQTRAGQQDDAVKKLGLDFLIVDNEHSPFSRPETADWAKTLAALGVVPIVRVPIPASHYITMALDAGAQGILAPYIERVEQVEECVAACKWLPLKGDVAARVVKEGRFPSEDTRKHLEERNKNNLLVIGIESTPALERLEDLLSVPGVDAAFVGPNDLSIQLGVPANYHHPKYIEAVKHIHDTCRRKRVPLVIHFFTHEMAEPFIQEGVHFVLFGSDRGTVPALDEHFKFLRGVKGPAA